MLRKESGLSSMAHQEIKAVVERCTSQLAMLDTLQARRKRDLARRVDSADEAAVTALGEKLATLQVGPALCSASLDVFCMLISRPRLGDNNARAWAGNKSTTPGKSREPGSGCCSADDGKRREQVGAPWDVLDCSHGTLTYVAHLFQVSSARKD